MNDKSIQEIAAKVSKELEREDLDDDTRQKIHELNRHAGQLHRATAPDMDALLDIAKTLESRFIAEHPTIARLVREIADTIGKMGI